MKRPQFISAAFGGSKARLVAWLAVIGLVTGLGATIYEMIVNGTVSPVLRYLETWALGGAAFGAICGLVSWAGWSMASRLSKSRRAMAAGGGLGAALPPAIITAALVPVAQGPWTLAIFGVALIALTVAAATYFIVNSQKEGSGAGVQSAA